MYQNDWNFRVIELHALFEFIWVVNDYNDYAFLNKRGEKMISLSVLTGWFLNKDFK